MNAYTSLAREAVEKYVKEGEIMSLPDDLPEEFYNKRAGVFVSIKKQGELRACIGTSIPAKNNIAGEIVANAISAASKDHRFGPVEATELPELSYEVYVLGAPEPTNDIEDLDPKKYGIVVNSVFGKTGLLLPDLEGVETPSDQLKIACEKAGIDIRSEDFSLYRFTADKYEE